jgi:proteic killer suppression protein
VKRYQARIAALEESENIEQLYAINSLHYEKLHGDRDGLESIRVNNQYRIIFQTTREVSKTVVTICNIIELSNHYK